MRERWVVISNCQSFGLASSINALAKDIDCTPCDHFEFKRLIAEDPDHFLRYDFAIVMPEMWKWVDGRQVALPPFAEVPGFHFDAYHPDCVYVLADGQNLNGYVGPYHSMIALAAYKEGLSAERAASFFNAEIFEAGDYFSLWPIWRDHIVGEFRTYGLDIASMIVRRSRGRCFMHTIDHPKIEILFDIAQALLAKLGRPMHAGAVPPADILTGTTWPIYPEVGAHLGVRGAYLFHGPNESMPLELVPFLQKSMDVYAAWDKSRLRVRPQPRLIRIREAMRAAA